MDPQPGPLYTEAMPMTQAVNAVSSNTVFSRGILARRFCAFLADMLLVGLLSWGAAFIILVFGLITFGLGWLMFHIVPFVPLVYYTLSIGSTGATPGERLFGIALRQDATLARPNYAEALVWTLLLGLSFALACVPLALALVGPRHRAGHDLLSGLVMIRS